MTTPSLLPCGDSALTVQIGESVDAEANARIIALAAAVEEAARSGDLAGVLDIVPTYRSLLVRYDPERIRAKDLGPRLLEIAARPLAAAAAGRLWRIPCLYGGEVGQDLQEMARMKGLSPEELIALHSGTDYRVFMIGFAPGFAYLGGQPEILHTPRLPKPRQNIPRGAVGIGGQQGNINSVAGPSGWRFLGWTPVRSFDPARAEPFLFRAGDHIRFHPVGPEEARALEARSAAGEMIVTPEEIRA
ncbi:MULTISPECIES: 5-oxoprolinase subunit PxpB [Cereibacter]|uniref:5-oxoprolinase subunit PxpB n=1 Tax=Cereibacter TaxID=1653176 RepID=UPI0002EC7435|nr:MULTISPECIES: 5-oxoprolinase subunit PxpB [Cereibacter]MEA5160621.1 5-oxoprolinase subunit PxpB [Cereibacter johrii]